MGIRLAVRKGRIINRFPQIIPGGTKTYPKFKFKLIALSAISPKRRFTAGKNPSESAHYQAANPMLGLGLCRELKKMIKKLTFTLSLLLIWVQPVIAERVCLPDGVELPASWYLNFEPHRVIGNLYAVGGADLSVYLLTTKDGHILINTGMENSSTFIRRNIETLGFNISDVKILLVQQAHFDHTLALAELKKLTGAELWATAADAPILEDGGKSDPHFGECSDFRFPPVEVDRIITDQEVIRLGNLRLKTHLHPGHTQGSSSYTFTHSENNISYNVIVANMGSINQGKKLLYAPTYAAVAEDFDRTYRAQLALPIDIWVAAHASQYGRDKKYEPGQVYKASTFVDPQGYTDAVLALQATFVRQLLEEARAPHARP
jgi:metallo-beta-lactamase class B